jgi:purine-nucleoside phosphorylase
MANIDETIASTISTIQKLVPANLCHPKIGIVCGSGLSGLAENLREVVEVPYKKLEGFTSSTGVFVFLL